MGSKYLRTLIICVIILFSQPTLVRAQELTISATPSPTPVVIVYQLPYPGILPGHPFYFFKLARDKLWGFMISSPAKKAEFDLLQADKSFAAAQLLYKQKAASDLIVSTVRDGELYFADALKKSVESKKQGMDASDLLKRLRVANIKHQEIVLAMTKTTNHEERKKFTKELEKVKELGKKTDKLNSH